MSDDHPPGGSDSPPRKDRLVQTRVPRDLESRLKREAKQRRVSVSQFIRNVLEDTFGLVDGVLGSVDDIVTDSREFASQVRREATHVGSAARRRRAGARRDAQRRRERRTAPPEPADAEAEEPASASDAGLSHVQAWNPVVLNRSIRCSRCGGRMVRGERGYAGLSEAADRPAAWLCNDCIEEL
jgi:hypothetical protein